MKKIIAVLVALAALALAPSSRSQWAGVLGGSRPSASTADIIFYWGMEQSTYSNADKATGSATGTVYGTAQASTLTVKVGAHSAEKVLAGDHVTFTAASNVNDAGGAIGTWFYCTATPADFNTVFRISYSGNVNNNQILCMAMSTGFIEWQYIAGGTGTALLTTTGTAMATGNWYWVELYWNKAGNSYTLNVWNSAGSEIQTQSSSAATGTWTAPDTIDIGDDNSVGGIPCYYDNVLITNSTSRNLQLINTGTSF